MKNGAGTSDRACAKDVIKVVITLDKKTKIQTLFHQTSLQLS
jgi:hypothetical protein